MVAHIKVSVMICLQVFLSDIDNDEMPVSIHCGINEPLDEKTCFPHFSSDSQPKSQPQ